MTLRHSSGMISEAKRRLEKHRRNYMGRIHSNVFLYFSATPFSLSLSLSPSIFVSFVLCAPRSFFPRFRYVTLLSIHFRPPSLSFLAFARPGTTLRAVCIRTLDDYLLLPFPRNYFQPVASVRPLYVQD